MWSKTADLRQGPAITGPAELGVSPIPAAGTESAIPAVMRMNVTCDGQTEIVSSKAELIDLCLRWQWRTLRQRIARKLPKRRMA